MNGFSVTPMITLNVAFKAFVIYLGKSWHVWNSGLNDPGSRLTKTRYDVILSYYK